MAGATKGAVAPGTKIALKAVTYPPNQTLYIRNVPSANIQKSDIRISLYALFSTYGPVLDVVALKTMKMRGQAHILYRDVQTATRAMRELQGFEFFGLQLKISYAKSKSDTIAKLDGTFRMPSAAAGEVTTTELQQSIFNAPTSANLPAIPPAPVSLKPPGVDHAMEDGRSPTSSTAGQKRPRDEEEDDEESDVEMEEDSDDD